MLHMKPNKRSNELQQVRLARSHIRESFLLRSWATCLYIISAYKHGCGTTYIRYRCSLASVPPIGRVQYVLCPRDPQLTTSGARGGWLTSPSYWTQPQLHRCSLALLWRSDQFGDTEAKDYFTEGVPDAGAVITAVETPFGFAMRSSASVKLQSSRCSLSRRNAMTKELHLEASSWVQPL